MPRLREGTPFEDEASYSRAAREGDLIAVSGAASLRPDGTADVPGEVYAQTKRAFETCIAAANALAGEAPAQPLRTRIFLAPDADWRAASRAPRRLPRQQPGQ